ncbi:MAG: protein kinase, partial [Bryobacteraceae bacterium]
GHTRTGVILGTAAYMSPEQAVGRAVDRRSDIFSFGAVLYEMLTGKRAFAGATTPDVLEAVVKNDPDWSALPAGTPAYLRRLLERMLAKDRKQRLQAIGEARIELENPERDEPGLVTASRSRLGRLTGIAAGVLAIVAAVGLAGWYRATRPAELKPLVRLDVDLGTNVSLDSQAGADTIISPDGMRLVYVSQGELFTRRMDQPKAVELAGTEGAYALFFSPDGQWVAFFANSKLKKISVEGGAAVALCDALTGNGGSWGEDGNIIAALSAAVGLSRIPSAGGAPTPVTELAQGEITHRWPQILPGGKAVLFTSNTSASAFDGANIEVSFLADHRRKTLQRGGTFGRYLPATNGTGHLVYINKGTLFAVPFDPDKLEVRGTPSAVLEEVAYNTGTGSAQLDSSLNGTLVYRSGGSEGGLLTVARLDGAGKAQLLLAKPGVYGRHSLSPDGQQLALDVPDGSANSIWVYDWQRDTMTRLTFAGNNLGPVWSPDGRYIAYRAQGEGMSVTRSDGAGKPQPLTQSKNAQWPWSFTPDGKRLAFYEQVSGTPFHLWTVLLESDGAGLRAGKPEVFLQTPADERNPSFSPDGRWLAYMSNESGTFQVYVRAFPDKGGKWQISYGGGQLPVWSRSGHDLFFGTLDNHIMVAAYTLKGESFMPDKPRLWSEKKLGGVVLATEKNFDLAPAGKRIAALMPAETPESQQSQNHVVFLENFSDELQRKVPIGK